MERGREREDEYRVIESNRWIWVEAGWGGGWMEGRQMGGE